MLCLRTMFSNRKLLIIVVLYTLLCWRLFLHYMPFQRTPNQNTVELHVRLANILTSAHQRLFGAESNVTSLASGLALLRQSRQLLGDQLSLFPPARAATSQSPAVIVSWTNITVLLVLTQCSSLKSSIPECCGGECACVAWIMCAPAASTDHNHNYHRAAAALGSVTLVGRGPVPFGLAVNRLMARCRTQLAFVAMTTDRHLSLEKLRFLARPLVARRRVAAVGGGGVDARGRWSLHCWRTRSFNWRLDVRTQPDWRWLTRGWQSWLWCDDVGGPLLISVEAWRRVPLPELTCGDWFSTMRSWFLIVTSAGLRSAIVPAVTFNISSAPGGWSAPAASCPHSAGAGLTTWWQQPDVLSRDTWRPLVAEWHWDRVTVDSVVVAGGRVEETCDCSHLSVRRLVNSWLAPPCCLRDFSRRLSRMLLPDARSQLPPPPHELMAGNVLAAVKLGRQLPWDFDVDIRFLHNDMRAWKRRIPAARDTSPRFSGGDRRVSILKHRLTGFSVDFWGDERLLSHSDGDGVTTVAQYGHADVDNRSLWLPVPHNPGQYARDNYGPRCLQHVAHWRAVSLAGALWEQRTVASWSVCPVPAHHACLQNSPLDGNVWV